jgi:hypothetical protein
MMASDFDISEVLRIEMNKAIEKTIRRNPTVKILNLEEMRADEIATYFTKNRVVEQLDYILQKPTSEQSRYFELARWFKVVLGELHTIATNKQSCEG